MTSSAPSPRRRIRLVGHSDGDGAPTIWGLTTLERARRIGARLGISDVAANVADSVTDNAAGDVAGGLTLWLRADTIIEDRIVPALFARAPVVLHGGTAAAPGAVVAACAPDAKAGVAAALVAGQPAEVPPGWTALTADAPALSYNETLRKRAVPFVLNLTETPLRAVERRMFGASYKGATDFVTKWLWPEPAFHATRACAALGLSPNQVTAVSGLLVLAAMALFWTGWFGVGLAAAWGMTFLDTVDGKLARVTVTSSKWGNVFDHGIDMVHPPFWYWAWWVGLQGSALEPAALGGVLSLEAAFWIIVAGYVLGRLQEGAFIALFKFEMHVWQPFDFWFRTVTARRNPNLAILTVGTALGAPADAFVAVALWTIVGLIVHTVRLFQAIAVRNAGAAVASFLSEPPPGQRA